MKFFSELSKNKPAAILAILLTAISACFIYTANQTKPDTAANQIGTYITGDINNVDGEYLVLAQDDTAYMYKQVSAVDYYFSEGTWKLNYPECATVEVDTTSYDIIFISADKLYLARSNEQILFTKIDKAPGFINCLPEGQEAPNIS